MLDRKRIHSRCLAYRHSTHLTSATLAASSQVPRETRVWPGSSVTSKPRNPNPTNPPIPPPPHTLFIIIANHLNLKDSLNLIPCTAQPTLLLLLAPIDVSTHPFGRPCASCINTNSSRPLSSTTQNSSICAAFPRPHRISARINPRLPATYSRTALRSVPFAKA